MKEEELYKLKSYLDRSPNRQKILKVLNSKDEPLRPTDISKETGVQRTTISERITDLEEKGLVKILNPEDNRNRYYKITKKGKKVM